jgi:hypothetical protein
MLPPKNEPGVRGRPRTVTKTAELAVVDFPVRYKVYHIEGKADYFRKWAWWWIGRYPNYTCRETPGEKISARYNNRVVTFVPVILGESK